MCAHRLVTALCALMLACSIAHPQTLTIYTLAGRPAPGAADGFGTKAQFNVPVGVAADAVGNVYVADTAGHTIRKISPDRAVTTLAGQPGNPGSADGLGTNALFFAPQGIALDDAGNVYVADTGNSTVRKITLAGMVSTLAGAAGSHNSFDGPAANARFYHPQALAVDPATNIFVADTWNHTIRKISPDAQVTTLAGLAGYFGAADGTNSKARFNLPSAIALDTATNLYITDFLNHTIRRISPAGTVSTIAGLPGVWGTADATNTAARFFQPQGIAASSAGDLFVLDSGNHTLRQISPAGPDYVVRTVAGLPGAAGDFDGTGSAAQFCFPAGLALDAAGNLLVADAGNNSIRTDRITLPLLDYTPSGGLLVLSWPGSSVNFALETAATLPTGSAWAPITNGVTLVGDSFLLTTNMAAAAAFYRLHQK